MWFFAPPSAWQRFPAAEARSYTDGATGVDPTNDTPETSGCSSVQRNSVAVDYVEDSVGDAGLSE